MEPNLLLNFFVSILIKEDGTNTRIKKNLSDTSSTLFLSVQWVLQEVADLSSHLVFWDTTTCFH